MNVLLEKSLINCHCYGLDSLVIKDAPRMVRVFVARPDHELWRNHPHSDVPLSIALHPHHCDVTLMPLTGRACNVSVGKFRAGEARALYPYRYSSPIGTGHGSFDAAPDTPLNLVTLMVSPLFAPLFLPANEAHTVFVPKGEAAAWLVWEGDESGAEESLVYSDAFLEDFDFSSINLPMTPERLAEDLAIINVKGWC